MTKIDKVLRINLFSFINVFPSFVQDLDDTFLQNIAKEMNLAETAYVKLLKDGDTFKKCTYVFSSI